ncbi:MAG: DUF2608 domain-containing protein, partial [Holosporaceae bacterium]|nr:DUF2608 domain-containing protein [Holosporaceae bacterium]
MEKTSCYFFAIIAMLQWTVATAIENNNAQTIYNIVFKGHKCSNNQPFHRNTICCHSWDDIKAQLQILKEKNTNFGKFPLLLIDYNKTLVFSPYYVIAKQFIRVNDDVMKESDISNLSRLCCTKKSTSSTIYEGDIMPGALDCIKSYVEAGFFSMVITIGSHTMHPGRSVLMDSSGLSRYIKLPQDKFNPLMISDNLYNDGFSISYIPLSPVEYWAHYIGGHIYCPKLPEQLLQKSKGSTFLSFINCLRENPSYVIAIDEMENNILALNETCAYFNIPFVGFILNSEDGISNDMKKAVEAHDPKVLSLIDECVNVIREANVEGFSVVNLPVAAGEAVVASKVASKVASNTLNTDTQTATSSNISNTETPITTSSSSKPSNLSESPEYNQTTRILNFDKLKKFIQGDHGMQNSSKTFSAARYENETKKRQHPALDSMFSEADAEITHETEIHSEQCDNLPSDNTDHRQYGKITSSTSEKILKRQSSISTTSSFSSSASQSPAKQFVTPQTSPPPVIPATKRTSQPPINSATMRSSPSVNSTTVQKSVGTNSKFTIEDLSEDDLSKLLRTSPSVNKIISLTSQPPVAPVTKRTSQPPINSATILTSPPPVAPVTKRSSQPPVAPSTMLSSQPPVAPVTMRSSPSVNKIISPMSPPPVAPSTIRSSQSPGVHTPNAKTEQRGRFSIENVDSAELDEILTPQSPVNSTTILMSPPPVTTVTKQTSQPPVAPVTMRSSPSVNK